MPMYGGPELANAFRTVRRNTIQLAEDIPEDKYDFSPAPETMSVGAMLKHIAFAPRLQEDMHRDKRVTTLKGYDFPAAIKRISEEESRPRTKAQILEVLNSEGDRFASWLESLKPEFLDETFSDVTGQNTRTRFEGLLSPKEHEMHHRGQLMLMQRMLGIVPHLTRQRQERMRARAAAPAT